ncbi:hypothetical protein Csa_015874 [Cucumis sativus]|nr:hypothetical protein Csa_015874 [Cucumis sativus]
MDKSKRLFLKSKRSFRRRLPPIPSGDRIDYRNMSLISRFISEQGKILSRRTMELQMVNVIGDVALQMHAGSPLTGIEFVN